MWGGMSRGVNKGAIDQRARGRVDDATMYVAGKAWNFPAGPTSDWSLIEPARPVVFDDITTFLSSFTAGGGPRRDTAATRRVLFYFTSPLPPYLLGRPGIPTKN